MIDFAGIELLGGLLGAGRLDNVLGLKHRVVFYMRSRLGERIAPITRRRKRRPPSRTAR